MVWTSSLARTRCQLGFDPLATDGDVLLAWYPHDLEVLVDALKKLVRPRVLGLVAPVLELLDQQLLSDDQPVCLVVEEPNVPLAHRELRWQGRWVELPLLDQAEGAGQLAVLSQQVQWRECGGVY